MSISVLAIFEVSLLSLLVTIEILVLVWPAYVQSFCFHQLRNCGGGSLGVGERSSLGLGGDGEF